MNKRQITTNTQLDKANEVLKDLSVNVTTSDRRAAMKELNIKSRATVIQYLKGNGRDLDLAMDLIGLFNERISSRKKALESAA